MRVPSQLFLPAATPSTSAETLADKEAIDRTTAFINSLSALQGGDVVTEERVSLNRILLANGDHGIATIDKDHTVLMGIGADVRLQGARVNAPCTFKNVRFEFTADEFVDITNGAWVRFENCMFIARPSGRTTHVTMEAGGLCRAIFIACNFYYGLTDPAVPVIDSPGAITDAQVIGCYNFTGNLYGNVTLTGSF